MSEDVFNDNAMNHDGENRDGHSPSEPKRSSERPRFSHREPVSRSNGYDNYRPNGGYEQRSYNRYDNSERPNGYGQRPQNRYNRYGEGNGQQGGYQSNYNNYGERRSYRPRFNNNGEGENGEGHYTPNRNYGGGYQPRQNGYRPENRFGKYTPRGPRTEGYNGGASYGNRDNAGQGENGYHSYNRPAYNRGAYDDGRRTSYGRPAFGGGQRRPAQGRPGYNPHAKYSMKKRLEYKEANYDPNEPVRLNKFLANAGVCSRRDADKYIESGVVTVNGNVVTELGTKVLRTDVVLFHDQAVKMEKKVYVLLNKPKGYVTTSEDPENRKTVMDLVKNVCPERIYPVGRLDRNTTGVLLFTNDGELASKLTHPKFLKKKIYHVYLDRNVSAGDLQQIASGITLEDGDIKADAIEYASPTDKKQVGIEIHSGKNRIVRRIFEHLGYHVVKLDRVYFAGLTKKNVKRGDWRFLTEKEVDMLRMGAFE